MISSKETSLKLGLSHRTIRLYCQQGKLDCEKISNKWYVSEESLDNFVKVEVIGKTETVRQTGKEKETFKSLDLPPFYIMSQRIGYLEGKLEMLERENTLLREQLTYQKTSWVRKLFKR